MHLKELLKNDKTDRKTLQKDLTVDVRSQVKQLVEQYLDKYAADILGELEKSIKKEAFIDSITPKKGKHYFDGEKGEPGKHAIDEQAVIQEILQRVPRPLDGQPGLDGRDADPAIVTKMVLEQIPKTEVLNGNTIIEKVNTAKNKIKPERIEGLIEELSRVKKDGTGKGKSGGGGITEPLAVSKGGTGLTTIAANTIWAANSTDTLVAITPSASQSIRINSGGTAWEAYTPGSSGGLTWSEVTGTTQAAAVNSAYITNNAAAVTVTLPDTAAVGDVLRVVGKGAGGWVIAQNASENINLGNATTTTGVGGSLASSHRYDCVELVCTVANTTWTVMSVQSAGLTVV